MLENLILLLPCFACLHSAVNLFVTRKSNCRSQNIWMVCMLSMSVCSYIWSTFYVGVDDFKTYYKLDIIGTTLGLTIFPYIYIYLKSLTGKEPFNWTDYIWFLPSVFIGISSFTLYTWMGDERATAYMQQVFLGHKSMRDFNAPVYRIHYAINIVLYYATIITQTILLTKYTITRLIIYRKRLKSLLPDSNTEALQNTEATLLGVFVMSVLFIFSFIETFFLKHSLPQLTYILILAYVTTLYFINHQVTQVNLMAKNQDEHAPQADNSETAIIDEDDEDADDDYKSTSIIKNSRKEEITLRIESLLNKDQIFLKKNLCLDDLVHLTQTNRTYISLLINEEYGCSFSELINRRRIEYAQKLVSENPNLLHAQISEESGFSHPSSFSRTFKQYVGMTFREWHKMQ